MIATASTIPDIIEEGNDNHGGHDHDHDHTHSSRSVVEQHAVDAEGEDTPGTLIGKCLKTILDCKGIVTSAELRRTIESLEQMGRDLLGAALVARAWIDADFKKMLLQDGTLTSTAKYFAVTARTTIIINSNPILLLFFS